MMTDELDPDPIDADIFVAAVKRSGLTMREVGERLGVDRSTVYAYSRSGVTKAKRIRTFVNEFGLWLRDETDEPFSRYSDQALIEELARRLEERRRPIE